jgi:hypothetical protein
MKINNTLLLTVVSVISLCLFTGCTERKVPLTEDKSFEGFIDSIEGDSKLYVECSKAIIERNSEGVADTMARLCSVMINKDTSIIGLDGNSLDKNSLKEGQIVKIVLDKTKDINEDVSSRNVKAKEIIVLEETIK